MTLENFRYWLDGYSVVIKDAPTKEQWEIILDKLAGIGSLKLPSPEVQARFETIAKQFRGAQISDSGNFFDAMAKAGV